jgi:hypothetical protein
MKRVPKKHRGKAASRCREMGRETNLTEDEHAQLVITES